MHINLEPFGHEQDHFIKKWKGRQTHSNSSTDRLHGLGQIQSQSYAKQGKAALHKDKLASLRKEAFLTNVKPLILVPEIVFSLTRPFLHAHQQISACQTQWWYCQCLIPAKIYM